MGAGLGGAVDHELAAKVSKSAVKGDVEVKVLTILEARYRDIDQTLLVSWRENIHGQ